MKIKFIKDYRFIGNDPDDGSDTTVKTGSVIDLENDESTKWLIDNGFAEEAKESGWWKPKCYKRYYYIGEYGRIKVGTWNDCLWDKNLYVMGNVFKTEEAAKRCRDYLEAIATVRQDEGVIDLQGICEEYETEDNKYNDFSVYTVAFDLYLRRLVVTDADEYISANAIWFEDEEYAQSSLDNHPDEWKTIVNYDWGRETEYVYKERYAELSNNGKEDK